MSYFFVKLIIFWYYTAEMPSIPFYATDFVGYSVVNFRRTTNERLTESIY